MRRPNPWDSRVGLRIEAAESGARGGKSRGRHLHCVCFSCSPGSHFLRVHTKRQRLCPQIGRRRCLAFYYRTSNENRRHFSASHISVGIRRRAAYASLARRAVHFLRVHTKRQCLRPQIGRRRCLALIIARRMRTGGTFPRPRFRWGSGESRYTRRLRRGRRAAGGSRARR